MGDSVKNLAEIKLDNSHCSPLIYEASYAIVESYQSDWSSTISSW